MQLLRKPGAIAARQLRITVRHLPRLADCRKMTVATALLKGHAAMQHPSSPLARRIWRLLAAVVLALLSASALAAPVSAADEKNVRGVIQAQLAAFAADDAQKAFSYAAPNIRKSVASAEHFMALVRGEYAVVYRPASVAFMKPERDGSEIIQPVQMSDAEGATWMAIYTLERQKNKLWRITGCFVQSTHGRMV